MKKLKLSLFALVVMGLGANYSLTAYAETFTQQPEVRQIETPNDGAVIRREERTGSHGLLEYRSVVTVTAANVNLEANAFMLTPAGNRLGASGWQRNRHQVTARSHWRWDSSRTSGEWRTR